MDAPKASPRVTREPPPAVRTNGNMPSTSGSHPPESRERTSKYPLMEPLEPIEPLINATERLQETLAEHQGQRLAIFIKGYPDPDSIGSALAHQHICGYYAIETDVIHFEDLSHHENKALVKRLDISLLQWKPDMDLTQYAGYCLVDSQSPDLPIPLPDNMPLVTMVDHHRRLGPIEGQFVDIREDAGSTCSIYCEYLANGPWVLDGSSTENVRLATALMHGIRSDTDDFIAARPIDFEASSYLAPIVDRELLTIVSEQSISSKSMDILHVALDKKIIKSNYLLAGVGYVREEDRDGIGEAADYLLKREGIDTALVYGIVGKNTIDGSLRTTSNTVDPDKWMKDLFGVDKEGRYYGGGRRDKGGFQIPLGIFARCSDRELLWSTVQRIIEDLFFEKIGETRDKQ